MSTYEFTWRQNPYDHHLHNRRNVKCVMCVDHQQIICIKLPIILNQFHATGRPMGLFSLKFNSNKNSKVQECGLSKL
jgi:hypothetical protein